MKLKEKLARMKAEKEAQIKKVEAFSEMAKDRTDETAAKANKTGKGKKYKKYDQPRLPDGSEFTLIWHAERGVWWGRLKVPRQGAEIPMGFSVEASAAFTVMARLDRMYRQAAGLIQSPPLNLDEKSVE